MKRVLIIGGHGFIGRLLYSRLKEKININVNSIDKNIIDLSDKSNIENLRKIIKLTMPEYIIILAAIKRQDGDSISIKDYNNKITDNISDALIDQVSRVIYLSSCAVYGEKNNQTNYTELGLISPTSEYGEHKVYSENIYLNKIIRDNLLIFRPPLIYDLNQENGYHPGGFLHQAISEGKIYLWGNGEEKREFIYLNDAVKSIINAVDDYNSGIYNLTSGSSFSYKEIALLIRSNIDCKIEERKRTGGIVNHSYDNSALIKNFKNIQFATPLELIDEYFRNKF